MPGDELLGIYKVIVRAALEYCSVVYHSMIPEYMADRLERMQMQAMKIIYGRNVDYGEMVAMGRIETLESRRIAACLKFAEKAAATTRFGQKWFRKNVADRDTRSSTRRIYAEKFYRTERGRSNPVQYMVRLLNEQQMSS